MFILWFHVKNYIKLIIIQKKQCAQATTKKYFWCTMLHLFTLTDNVHSFLNRQINFCKALKNTLYYIHKKNIKYIRTFFSLNFPLFFQCFMNSVLQCLANTKCLLEYCIHDKYEKDINRKTSSMKGALFKGRCDTVNECSSELYKLISDD